MKKFLSFFAFALLSMSLFVSTGCDEDETDPDLDIAPLLIITSSPASTVQDQDATVTFTVEVTKGTQVLNTLTITEDGSNVDAARITITGIDPANNPQLITGSDTDGLTWDITINVHDAFDIRTYEVIVEDKAGLTDSETFNVSVENPSTPLTVDLVGVLFNQLGPAGRGAIDLDSGNTTGISTADPDTGTLPEEAELRDMGIDITIDPAVAENWRAQITGVNSSIVRILTMPSAENFTFDGVSSKEQITSEWDAANSLPNQEDVGGVMQSVSDPVQVGDIFIIQDENSRLFMIQVDEVNAIFGDNEDNYKVSIKS